MEVAGVEPSEQKTEDVTDQSDKNIDISYLGDSRTSRASMPVFVKSVLTANNCGALPK